jgi:hypothetical protein
MCYPAATCGVKKIEFNPKLSPRMVLSWFDCAHHDPEPRRMGRGSIAKTSLWNPAKHMRE